MHFRCKNCIDFATQADFQIQTCKIEIDLKWYYCQQLFISDENSFTALKAEKIKYQENYANYAFIFLEFSIFDFQQGGGAVPVWQQGL